jgi:hypothetical protein
MPAAKVADAPTQQDDDVILLYGATWADFQRLLELRGDHSAPRISFLEARSKS